MQEIQAKIGRTIAHGWGNRKQENIVEQVRSEDRNIRLKINYSMTQGPYFAQQLSDIVRRDNQWLVVNELNSHFDLSGSS